MLDCLAMNPFLCVMNLSKEKIRNYRKRNEAIPISQGFKEKPQNSDFMHFYLLMEIDVL